MSAGGGARPRSARASARADRLHARRAAARPTSCRQVPAGIVQLGQLLDEAGVGAAGADLLERGEVARRSSAPKPPPSAARARRRGRRRRADRRRRSREAAVPRLDLDPAVALESRRCGNQLADDHVLLEPVEAVLLALQRGIGQHLGRLLEGGRREERVGVQRRLCDAEDDVLELRRLAAGLLDGVVGVGELEAVDELTRQVVRVALLIDAHLLEHLAHDQLDVLVVDVHAL